MTDEEKKEHYRHHREVVLPELRRRYGFAYFHWWWSWVRLGSWLSKHGAPVVVWVVACRIAHLDPFRE